MYYLKIFQQRYIIPHPSCQRNVFIKRLEERQEGLLISNSDSAKNRLFIRLLYGMDNNGGAYQNYDEHQKYFFHSISPLF